MDIIQQATQKIEEGQSCEAQGQLREALRCYRDALGMLQSELDALGEDAPAELRLLAGGEGVRKIVLAECPSMKRRASAQVRPCANNQVGADTQVCPYERAHIPV